MDRGSTQTAARAGVAFTFAADAADSPVAAALASLRERASAGCAGFARLAGASHALAPVQVKVTSVLYEGQQNARRLRARELISSGACVAVRFCWARGVAEDPALVSEKC